MKDDNLYFLQLTVYQYDKNKTKMDYSVIPVTFKEYEKNWMDYSGCRSTSGTMGLVLK